MEARLILLILNGFALASILFVLDSELILQYSRCVNHRARIRFLPRAGRSAQAWRDALERWRTVDAGNRAGTGDQSQDNPAG